MAIPKTIYQTFKTAKLPLITKWHIKRMKKMNPEYDYQFFDDERIEKFIKNEFETEVFDLYRKINIGAAKADFFRYAILYKKGGVYLDIDSLILKKIDDFIFPNDSAVIALENNLEWYIQFVLFYEPGHPFLKKTLDMLIENLKQNKYPYEPHKMTGPTLYSLAIRDCINNIPNVKYRQMDVNFNNYVKFSYRMSKTCLYGISRKNHWKRLSKTKPIMKIE
jgi:mannosyltransferase OCH1-like enzyme